MSSRVNIMEIENFLFTAKVENLFTAKSSMWRQDDNNDIEDCRKQSWIFLVWLLKIIFLCFNLDKEIRFPQVGQRTFWMNIQFTISINLMC